MKLKSLILLLLGAAMLGGCCSACRQRTKNAKPLEGTVWHLVQIEGRDAALEAGTFDITLDGGSLSGIGACNRLMGSYTVAPKSGIRFGAIASTRMMCPNVEMESQLAAVLESATHYDIDYDILMIMQDGTIKAMFKAAEGK